MVLLVWIEYHTYSILIPFLSVIYIGFGFCFVVMSNLRETNKSMLRSVAKDNVANINFGELNARLQRLKGQAIGDADVAQPRMPLRILRNPSVEVKKKTSTSAAI